MSRRVVIGRDMGRGRTLVGLKMMYAQRVSHFLFDSGDYYILAN